MKNYPTPHINATPEDFAKTVLMPGDPLRAEFMAQSFLENPVLINSVREMLCGDLMSGLLRLLESVIIAMAIACGFAVPLLLSGYIL